MRAIKSNVKRLDKESILHFFQLSNEYDDCNESVVKFCKMKNIDIIKFRNARGIFKLKNRFSQDDYEFLILHARGQRAERIPIEEYCEKHAISLNHLRQASRYLTYKAIIEENALEKERYSVTQERDKIGFVNVAWGAPAALRVMEEEPKKSHKEITIKFSDDFSIVLHNSSCSDKIAKIIDLLKDL